ncbi:MAG: SDR family oxidoreductase, partial [Myxococcota bacterium]|nr:SDR family oxidoreductase [Myxococcota bacterium]
TGGLAVRMDLADREGTAASVGSILEQVSQVDLLINNAGIAEGAPLSRTSDALWDRILQVNAWGSLAMCRSFMPALAERGWGRVVNIASIAGLTGQAYTAAYCASKHALVGLTRALAVEFARSGVTVNAVCPGWVETEMAQEAIDRIVQSTGRDEQAARAGLERQSPQGRMVDAAEVAALVAMLCREESRGIHGQAIPVDGGTLMR